MHEAGYAFGPAFRQQIEIEAAVGTRKNRARLSLRPPESDRVQSKYPLHPAVLDSCFQSGAASLWQGLRASVDSVLVPANIDSLTIMAQEQVPEKGIAICSADYLGFGSREVPWNHSSQVSVFDDSSAHPLMKMVGLHYHRLETQSHAQASWVYSNLTWLPDISILSQKHVGLALGNSDKEKSRDHSDDEWYGVRRMLDLLLHKRPNPRVAEVNLLGRSDSLWLDTFNARKSVFRTFDAFVSTNEALLDAQERYDGFHNVRFGLAESTDHIILPMEQNLKYDLKILSKV